MGEGTTEAVVETEEMDVVVTTTIKEVDQNLYGRLGHPSAGGEGASKKNPHLPQFSTNILAIPGCTIL